MRAREAQARDEKPRRGKNLYATRGEPADDRPGLLYFRTLFFSVYENDTRHAMCVNAYVCVYSVCVWRPGSLHFRSARALRFDERPR